MMKYETKLRIETGIQRAYYVCWFLFSSFYSFALVWQWKDSGFPVLSTEDMFIAFVLILAILLLPGALMVTVRWVYRGFNGKPD
jgi:hypothetical protein